MIPAMCLIMLLETQQSVLLFPVVLLEILYFAVLVLCNLSNSAFDKRKLWMDLNKLLPLMSEHKCKVPCLSILLYFFNFYKCEPINFANKKFLN